MMAATQSRPNHERKRTFSFGSSKSSHSNTPRSPKLDLTETSKDKQRLSEKSSINPNRALAEAQPADRVYEKNTLTFLSSLQHKDATGNLITDADASNPSRPRLERPLDTIRSFEAAIDNSYKRREPLNRLATSDGVTNGRRPSNGYAGHSAIRGAYRQDNSDMNPSRRPIHMRNSTAPSPGRMSNDYGEYPINGYYAHDMVNDSNSTDPSSENSSVDRIQAPNNGYNDAYGRGSPMQNIEEHGQYDGNARQAYPAQPPPVRHPYNHNPTGANLPPVPPKQHIPQRNVIPLGGENGPKPNTAWEARAAQPTHRPAGAQRQASDKSEKRKSWLSRRFSRG